MKLRALTLAALLLVLAASLGPAPTVTGMEDDMELPNWIRVKSKNRFRFRTPPMPLPGEPVKWYDVTIADLIRYYHGDARNISSGCRTLGPIVGDWRPIDELAPTAPHI